MKRNGIRGFVIFTLMSVVAACASRTTDAGNAADSATDEGDTQNPGDSAPPDSAPTETALAETAGDTGDCHAGLGTAQCPILPDSGCPADCVAVLGPAWDEIGKCFGGPKKLIVCVRTGVGFDKEVGCVVKDATGEKFASPMLLPCPLAKGLTPCGDNNECGSPTK